MVHTIGVTGSRRGFNGDQQRLITVNDLLIQIEINDLESPPEFHHGACVGIDEDMACIAHGLGFRVIAHPPFSSRYLSKIALSVSDAVLPAKEYIDRNRDIVLSVNVLFVVPWENEPQEHGGTWNTCRYAETMNSNYVLFYPNGQVKRVSTHFPFNQPLGD